MEVNSRLSGKHSLNDGRLEWLDIAVLTRRLGHTADPIGVPGMD